MEGKIGGSVEVMEYGEEDVNSYLTTLRKLEDTGIRKEALDCTVWRTHIGRGCGSVVR
jgi:hypothetical protein